MKVHIPADKSITHRAFIFAAMAKGASRIENPLLGADCLSTLHILEKLGSRVSTDESGAVTIDSPGYRGWHSPQGSLDCGNSGTTLRLMTGVLAAIPDLKVTLDGDDSLRTRPLRRLTDLVAASGGCFEYQYNKDGLPLVLHGQALSPIQSDVPVASAQLKSALILASLCTSGSHVISTPVGSRDHTELFCRFIGIDLKTELTITIKGLQEKAILSGPQEIPGFQVSIPADPSSAAFFATLALLHPKISRINCENVLLNPTRCGFFQVLQESGATIDVTPLNLPHFSEPVAFYSFHNLSKDASQLRAFDIKADRIPTLIDEIPLLALCAAFANGTSTIRGIDELRHKESDRLAQSIRLLGSAGVNIQVINDELVIHGPTVRLCPFSFDTQNDHRLAMCAAIMEKLVGSACHISHRDCVDISFPNFYQTLEGVFAE